MSDEKAPVMAPQVSWDDQTGTTRAPARKFERLKFKMGQKLRVLILDDKATHVQQHYKEGFGNFRCLQTIGQKCAACDAGSVPSEKFGVNVLVYPHDATAGTQVTAMNVSIVAWLFGKKVKDKISSIKSEWGAPTEYDLKLECTNEKYQHLEVGNLPTALVAQSPDLEAIKARIYTDSFELQRVLGRTLSPEQVDGIWNGTLTRDEVFTKSGDSSPQQPAPGVPLAPQSQPVTATVSSTPTVPPRLNFNELLGKRK